jgi:hypothetical protein
MTKESNAEITNFDRWISCWIGLMENIVGILTFGTKKMLPAWNLSFLNWRCHAAYRKRKKEQE